MNRQLVARITGILLLLEAVAMMGCGLFARLDVVADDEQAMIALFQSAGITGAVAALMIFAGGLKFAVKQIPRRDAVVIVGIGWLLSSTFGGLPYLLCPPGLDWAGAFFESASGFTTTGSSVMSDIEVWPRGLLLWRSVTQWLGGIGILVLFVAVLSYLGLGSKSLFQNESSFRGGESGMARIHETSLALLRIYLSLTAVCAAGLRAMGMSWFNSVCHTMTAVSTGGFSTHNKSVGFYSHWANGWLIELWLTIFMALCSLNFLLFVVILRKNWRRLRDEEDGKWLMAILGSAILVIAAGRAWGGEAKFLQALRDASFVVVSIASTTGFGTADYELWPAWSKGLLAILMLIGGCSGSTAGGFKVGRLLVFLKSARHEIVRAFRPNLVFRLVVNGNSINEEARGRTMFFLIMYFMICVVSMVAVGLLEAGTDISLETCGSAVLAAISNIGPGFGTVGPTENFGHFREATQVFLAWLMILGRLELFALLVLFFPSAWKRY
ncbi:MAG: TrkH family potassium uptake protein [Luteolibacter sp.]|jgi:trk system potassium uptake protein TrkH|nr:TrkH family potassium uptake protein [Luteolibacter sp.]